LIFCEKQERKFLKIFRVNTAGGISVLDREKTGAILFLSKWADVVILRKTGQWPMLTFEVNALTPI